MKTTKKYAIYIIAIGIPFIIIFAGMNLLMLTNETELIIQIVKNIFVLLILIVYGYYFHECYKNIKLNNILFMVVMTAVILIISFFMTEYDFLYMPILVGVMLTAIVSNKELAIVTHVISVIIIAIVGEMPVIFIVFYIVTGLVVALVISKAKERTKIFFVAIFLAIFNALFYILLSYIFELSFSITSIALAALNAGFSLVIAIGSLPLWETIFQVVTPLKLLEFVHGDNKLLQRLSVEAPGSYHHSIMVANLAERGATSIGANALLAKVAALYHDIGKMKQPMYFIENQNGGGNPHDDIAAEASANIIIEHVAYGVKLGKTYKLPKSVIQIIKQHHGTSLVAYFYHKAQKYDDGIDYDIEKFTYIGAKPQTNEAAIVMLADCVEAYVRSLDEKDRYMERIEDIIDEIIKLKIKDGQLEECDLKIKELPIIGEAFKQVYIGMYHERIKYPTNR